MDEGITDGSYDTTPTLPKYEKVLTASGVAESPLGFTELSVPDRYETVQIRGILNMSRDDERSRYFDFKAGKRYRVTIEELPD